MNLVKLKSTKGAYLYISPSFIIAPLQTVGQSSITFLPSGLTLEIDETAQDVAAKLGWKESVEL